MEEEEDHVPTKLSVAIENLERKMLANALDKEEAHTRLQNMLGISQSQVVRKAKNMACVSGAKEKIPGGKNSSGENKI